MASKRLRPGRTLAGLGAVVAILFGLVALGGEWSPRLGLDLQGGTRIILQASSEGGDPTDEQLTQARDIIGQRVNGTGVSAPEVSTRGDRQILVEIPGDERSDIVEEVGRTAQLRFRLVWGQGDGTASPPAPPGGDGPGGPGGGGPGGGGQGGAGPDGGGQDGGGQGGAGQGGGGQAGAGPGGGGQGGAGPGGGGQGGSGGQSGGAGQDGGTANRVAAGWMLRSDQQDGGDQGGGDQPNNQPGDQPPDQPPDQPTEEPPTPPDVEQQALGDILLPDSIQTTLTGQPPPAYTQDFTRLASEFAKFTCPDDPDAAALVDDEPGEPLITCDDEGIKYLLSPAVIEGTSLTDASAQIPPQSAQWVVNLELDGAGTDVFSDVTQALAGAPNALFAIVLDGQVLSAPTVNDPITNGQAQISGNFTQESANELANSLRYGALPLSFSVDSVVLAGPTLAGSSLAAGILAGIIGLALVVVYCILYYRALGLVVVTSLALAGLMTYELVILLGTSVGFTLTLPGIAGLIVGIGVTADSFIIYFERIRDEVRDGRSLRLATESGWLRARATILAADAVQFLAAVVLYTFAIDEVRGFAFGLLMSTIVDIIVVFLFSKPLISYLIRTRFFGQGHRLSGLDTRHLGITGRAVTQVARTPTRAAGRATR
ncbi:MAG: protein translocase subunit SecD [Nocardioidaceae bacterium]|nr:protein translocase subunit SecD [Nocardioidaceae bacterium]